MPIGPKITEDVRRLIATVYLEHTDWVAKQVMKEVHTRLKKEDPHVTPNWPKLSAIQIELKKLRRNYEAVRTLGQDDPWNLGTLDKYPIPPEALPSVLRVWAIRREHAGDLLTIREAKWVSRLYAIYKDPDKAVINRLTFGAIALAWVELLVEVAEVPSRSRKAVATLEYDPLTLLLYEDILGEPISEERADRIMRMTHPDERRRESETRLQKILYEEHQFTENFLKEVDHERPHNQAVQE